MNKPRRPKLYTANNNTGIRDADTVHMIPAVVFPNRMCGEMDTAHWGSTLVLDYWKRHLIEFFATKSQHHF